MAAALAVAAVVVAGLAQGPASAMTDRATDDDGSVYPAVVALLYVRESDQRVFPYCSGTLISETVVLTASHCNEGTVDYATSMGYTLAVTNDPVLEVHDDSGWVTADNVEPVASDDDHVITNDLYKGGYRDDVSVQVIEHELPGWAANGVPEIPPVGMLDELKKSKTLTSTPVTVVGYGTKEKSLPADTSPWFPDSNMRRYAVLPTIALDKQWIHQDQNLGRNPDQGGACYGDSGGPSLMKIGQDLFVVGVTSTGDGPCFATNVASRVDTESAHALIGSVEPGLLP
jgi:hypothetical protein